MKLVGSLKIQGEYLWQAELDGLFLKRDGTVKFCYLDYINKRDCVVAMGIDGNTEIWYTAPEGERLPLPDRWTGAAKGVPPMERLGYANDEEIFYFGDKTISHTSQWSLVCRRGEEKLWSFKGYAWRYTNIEQYGDNIYFGTAGQGGYFYLLNLHTGEPLLKLKTGGTVNMYARRDNRLYLLQQEKKANLVCIDLNDGAILERLELPGQAMAESAIRLIENTVHCVTFFYNKNRSYSHACWHRVEV